MLLRSSRNVAKQIKDAKIKQQMARAVASHGCASMCCTDAAE
jgi:hypothetical protein